MVIMIMPVTDCQSGFSPGRIIQLRITPETGTTNFHIFSSDTFTSGFLSNEYQMENPAAGMSASHIHAR